MKIGGWHDFRHTLNRKMRRAGVHPVVISGILGHKSVTLAAEVYEPGDGCGHRAGTETWWAESSCYLSCYLPGPCSS